MITHRNAAINTIGTLLYLPMAVGSRYLWTLPMFHANGWTYTWTVTAAAGTHICLRKVDPATIFGLIRDEHVSWLCAAPTVLISLANAPASVRGEVPADGQTVGEIVVRGNAVMEGYYNDPEATMRAMGDGWFHTGDAAVVHVDGYAEIRDRLKDVIISGGENISSVEVEGMLLRHPAVQEVAVVGLPHEKWGETPHAFIVLRDGGSATEEDIIGFARERLAHFKAPRGVTFVSELPKTATGKIQKFVLRKGAPNPAHR